MGSNLIGRAFSSFARIGEGLRTVLMHSFREPITKTYPDAVSQLPPHFRGRLGLNVNPDTGEHLCISCRQCERVCPDKCIEITAHKSPDTNKLELIDFKIDHGLCMFCGLCTEVCPTQCIINTNDFEMADYTRESLVYDIKRLTLTQEESGYYFEQKELPKPKPKPPKPAPGAAPAAPAGAKAAAPAAGAAAPAGAKAAPAAAAAKPAADAAAAPAADAAKPAADAAKPAETKPEAEAKPAESKPEAPAAKPETAEKPAEAKPEAAEKKEEKADTKTEGESKEG
ncbi:NADH-quinone oxidoreductase subunit I [Candidatus Obscuribacterales bacterium]|nr:NADH-quinone oxidoreductase subunit I [Candidatus Obscuribacterales bacterium]MBX3150546.1 NADH-quinone oxidoreductase subunit I [Candidatus Obscuribacterales bacterium]